MLYNMYVVCSVHYSTADMTQKHMSHHYLNTASIRITRNQLEVVTMATKPTMVCCHGHVTNMNNRQVDTCQAILLIETP